MSPVELLKNKIETERKVLDTLLQNNTVEEAYSQSRLVDELIEQYISLCN